MTTDATPPVSRVPGGRRAAAFVSPVFVIGAPGAGSEAVADLLAASPTLQQLTFEGNHHASVPRLTPRERGWDSERLSAMDAKPRALAELEADWRARLQAATGDDPTAGSTSEPRLLATYPAAALHIPFLRAAYPDARFVVVQRHVEECLTEMLSAWRAGTAVTHADLPGWNGSSWSYPLTPEWRSLDPGDLPAVVAHQWRKTSETLVAELGKVAPNRWRAVGISDLRADPEGQLQRLAEFLEIEAPTYGADAVALIPGATADHDVFAEQLPALGDINSRARELVTRAPVAEGQAASPLRSVSTSTFPELLDKLGSSLLITTYQSGRLVVARVKDGKLNTHFRAMESPMGIAHRQGLLAIGTKNHVWTYTDLPGLAPRLEPAGSHDACYAPRTSYFTGNIRIHDVAYAGGELWAVATRFSCLATFDGAHSFVPRWQPPFISALRPEDRCHLNGLAVVDDRVKYVTALGTTDTEGGWRPEKATGGIIMDVETNQIVASGLSMPHSPRWYQDSLWVLESGEGRLCRVDVDSGAVETVAELPGFTRGLAFAGRYAFVGLSEVREATTFGGLPLTARLEDRECGVWVVDIVAGETVGFLRFEDAVQEVFDVALLPGARFPEILDPRSEILTNAFALPTS